MSKVLVIDAIGASVDFCMRCEEHGHDVKLFIKRNKEGQWPKIGDGIVEKVREWRSWMEWADLIFLTDNAFFLDELEPYRKRGFPIFGPSVAAAELELDRSFGQKFLVEHGIETIPSEEFSNYDKAEKFVLENMKRYVSKPSGDADKALSYVSKSPADMVFMLRRWKETNKIKSPFILQEFKPGIEVAVGGWIGPGGFSKYFCENFEHKKLMCGEIGPNCYTPDGEVLTRVGWKFWPDLLEDDEVCTLVDGRIEFERPQSLTIGDFDGELVGWESPTVDLLVTPGHNMYVQDDHARKPMFFESAIEASAKNRTIMRGGGEWHAADDSSQLPEFYKGTLKAWAALLGIHIADGFCKNRSVQFGNCPEHKQKEFIDIAQNAGYTAKMYGKDLYINSKELADHFRTFGKAHEKYVPQYVKDSSREVIESFLYGYGCGDGSRREKARVFTTVSKRLADDVQEMLLKIGRYGAIRTRDRRGESHMLNGVECKNTRICYDVQENIERLKAGLETANCFREAYKGRVYCCTVTSHIIYVRRNGKATWQGQTGELGTVLRYSESSALAESLLRPLEQSLIDLGCVGYVDLNNIVDDDGAIWPLEFTVRPGWPTFNIQASLHDGDPIQWMLDLLDGRDTLECSTDTATGIVLAIPDFPYSEYTQKQLTGFPIYGTDDVDSNCLRLCEVMMGNAPVMDGDEVKNAQVYVSAGDYILVAIGTGETVSDSSDLAYENIEKIEMPNSAFYRIDIGERLRKQLPQLQKMGFCEGWEYG